MSKAPKTLKDWMAEQGYDQKMVAGLMGCAQSTVSRVLNGQDPSADFVRDAYRISEGAVEPNGLFPDLFVAAPAEAA